MSSKKERKKEKAREKGLYPLQSKLHYQQYQIPPYSQQHLRALFLEYLSRQIFTLPVHHVSVMNQIRSFYQNIQNSDIYMKDLDIEKIIIQIVKINAMNVRERALGTRIVLMIEEFNEYRINQLAQQYRTQRPTTPPPDPITFQQQKSLETQKQKQQRQKLQSILNAPSLFGNQVSLIQAANQMKSIAQSLEIEQFKNKMNADFCDHCTRQKCMKIKGPGCNKKHFRAIITANTDQSFGNCPHLNACHNPDCKLIHYVQEGVKDDRQLKLQHQAKISMCQWINCDMRLFDFTVLGKFDAVMADPPWDIHMNLPYGTMKDKEMLNLRVDLLQDDGVIFLWVTGRAMELGRQCLEKWGYKRVDEIVWVKTNQIQRLIITGKTGHWLNHSKEHCLVGIKGNPNINARLDCDVLVSTVRETSRKPDEIYGLIERICSGGKKIELFGRPQNCMPGWLTLGNQLPGTFLRDRSIVQRYRKTYPQQNLTDEKMLSNYELMNTPENYNRVYNNHIQKN